MIFLILIQDGVLHHFIESRIGIESAILTIVGIVSARLISGICTCVRYILCLFQNLKKSRVVRFFNFVRLFSRINPADFHVRSL